MSHKKAALIGSCRQCSGEPTSQASAEHSHLSARSAAMPKVRLAFMDWEGVPLHVRLWAARQKGGRPLRSYMGCGCSSKLKSLTVRLYQRGGWCGVVAKGLSRSAEKGAWVLSLALGMWLTVFPPTPKLRTIIERCVAGWAKRGEFRSITITGVDLERIKGFDPEQTRQAMAAAIRGGQSVGDVLVARSARAAANSAGTNRCRPRAVRSSTPLGTS